jgi:hypothetical protein
MAKKIVLLPLMALICFSLNAWDWGDPTPPYNYDIYNYYVERPWLLPPSEYYWYFETARRAPVQNTYNNYYTPQADPVVTPPVVLPLTSRVSDVRVSDVMPDSVALQCDPRIRSAYRFQDLEPSNAARSGYQGLTWGTTIAQFQSRLRGVQEITDKNDAFSRVRRFTQQSVDDGIQSRQFLFLDDRLYEVYVLYGNVDESIVAGMQERLVRLYGQPVDIIRHADEFDNGKYDISDIYLNYNSDMQVVLSICDVYDYSDTPQGTIMTCLYSNPRVR